MPDIGRDLISFSDPFNQAGFSSGQVPFMGPSQVIIKDTNFTYDPTTKALLVGGQVQFKAGTSFTGILTHANTANRTYTLPDRDETLDIEKQADYVIRDNSSTYIAVNGHLGTVDAFGADLGSVLNQITNLLTASGGSVFIKSNGSFYNVNTAIVFKTNVKYYSDGATLKNTNSLSVPFGSSNAAVLNRCDIVGLVFDANDSGRSLGYYGLQLYSPQFCKIDCWVKNATTGVDLEVTTTGTPIDAKRNAAHSIYRLYMDTVGTGLVLNGSPTGDPVANGQVVVTDNLFEYIYIRPMSLKGVRLVQYCDSNKFQFIYTNIDTNGGTGVIINDSASPTVDENGVYDEYFEEILVDAFSVTGVTGVQVNKTSKLRIDHIYGSPALSGGVWSSGTVLNIDASATRYFIQDTWEQSIFANQMDFRQLLVGDGAGGHELLISQGITGNATITYFRYNSTANQPTILLISPNFTAGPTGAQGGSLRIGYSDLVTDATNFSYIRLFADITNGEYRLQTQTGGTGVSSGLKPIAIAQGATVLQRYNTGGTIDMLVATTFASTTTFNASPTINAATTINVSNTAPLSINADNVSGSVSNVLTGYGGGMVIAQRRANGTLASPTSLLSGEAVGAHNWIGYQGSGFSIGAAINGIASENWDATHRGMRLDFIVTANTTTTNYTALRINNDGLIQMGSGLHLQLRDTALSANRTFDFPDASGTVVVTGAALGQIVNADVNASAAIAYSKLNLAASIVNADIAVGAAIAYSKLSLSNSIVNADIATGAAIDFSKLAALTSGNILVGSAGNIATSVVMSGDATIIASGALTIANNAVTDAKIASHTSTKVTITAKGQLNSALVYNDQANSFGAFNQTFKSSRLLINNPGDTFAYMVVASAIAANRNATLPLLAADDTFVFANFAQELQSKTIKASLNTLTDVAVYPSIKRWGAFSGVVPNNAVGIFQGNFQTTGTLTHVIDNTEGNVGRYTTGAVSGNQAGFRSATVWARLAFNSRMKARIKIDSVTNTRVYIGFTTQAGTFLTGDDPLNALSGVVFGIRSGDTNWKIMHNDGAGATVVDDTGVAADTNYHTIEIKAVSGSSKFQYSIDGAAFVDVSTEIPASTTNLTEQGMTETNEAVAKNFDCAYLDAETDK